jgi:hypothetical protein
MKKYILIFFLIIVTDKGFSQENMVSVTGGYAFANIDNSDSKGTGWNIKGLYEYNPQGGMIAHGFAFGYIGLSSEKGSGALAVKSTVNSFPIYYAPKLIFGKNKFKFFVKAAIGMQIAGMKREGAITFSDTDYGFYGGGGAGLMFFVKDNIFINADYEIAWASNSAYVDGWINTANGGLGFKF